MQKYQSTFINSYSNNSSTKDAILKFIKKTIHNLQMSSSFKVGQISIRLSYTINNQVKHTSVITTELTDEKDFDFVMKTFFERCDKRKIELKTINKVFLYILG